MERFRMLADKVFNLIPSATEHVDNTIKAMKRSGVTDIVSLGVGEPCFDTPENIKRAACDALMAGDTKYQPTAGSYALREAISAKFARENHIHAGIDDIVVTAGGKFAIYLAMQAVLQPGDTVLLIEPAWVTYEPAVVLTGAEVVKLPTNAEQGFKPDPEAVRRAMEFSIKMVVVNSPCNPTGAVYEPARLHEIARITEEHGALLLSDEVYEYQVFDAPLYSPASEFENVITVNAFSKSFAMTGWRLGYAAAPREVVEGMIKIYQHSTSSVTSFAQAGGIEALTNELSTRAAREMFEGYRSRRALMLRLIDESPYFELPSIPAGAIYCFPRYKVDANSVELATALLESVHVATVPGGAFGACGEGHLRMSFATGEAEITEAFRRMNDYFERC
jgi:aspartate aminotransferase